MHLKDYIANKLDSIVERENTLNTKLLIQNTILLCIYTVGIVGVTFYFF